MQFLYYIHSAMLVSHELRFPTTVPMGLGNPIYSA